MRAFIYILVATLATGSTLGYTQDFRQVVIDMQKKYSTAEDLRITMTVKVFSSKKSESPSYHEEVFIAKKGSTYHQRLSTTDMLMSENYIVVVDHMSHRIILNKRDVNGESNFNKQINFNIDSMLSLYEPGRYDGSENDVDKYTVVQKTGEIKEAELYVNHGSNDLRQINYLYRAGQWVTIVFETFELEPVFDVGEFDEKQFVRKSGKSWEPTGALAGYRIIDTDDNSGLKN